MSQINITNSTITYKHQVIKTANISSIDFANINSDCIATVQEIRLNILYL